MKENEDLDRDAIIAHTSRLAKVRQIQFPIRPDRTGFVPLTPIILVLCLL